MSRTETTHDATLKAIAAFFRWDASHPGSHRLRYIMSARHPVVSPDNSCPPWSIRLYDIMVVDGSRFILIVSLNDWTCWLPTYHPPRPPYHPHLPLPIDFNDTPPPARCRCGLCIALSTINPFCTSTNDYWISCIRIRIQIIKTQFENLNFV